MDAKKIFKNLPVPEQYDIANGICLHTIVAFIPMVSIAGLKDMHKANVSFKLPAQREAIIKETRNEEFEAMINALRIQVEAENKALSITNRVDGKEINDITNEEIEDMLELTKQREIFETEQITGIAQQQFEALSLNERVLNKKLHVVNEENVALKTQLNELKLRLQKVRDKRKKRDEKTGLVHVRAHSEEKKNESPGSKRKRKHGYHEHAGGEHDGAKQEEEKEKSNFVCLIFSGETQRGFRAT